MTHSWTVSFRQSAVSKSSALSKAIRDGDFAALQELIEECRGEATESSLADGSIRPNVLMQANSRGWTPLHVAASTPMPYSWWRWILLQAVTQDVKVKCFDQNTSLHQGPSSIPSPIWTAETEFFDSLVLYCSSNSIHVLILAISIVASKILCFWMYAS